ncbi:hypothetical protein BDY24DRAFT_268643 [Mrakia frigida]|uniref:uncharacterized protein n=1 Tax=Mrakia frigida TaxID=29902 RepID=UPI003FCC0B76
MSTGKIAAIGAAGGCFLIAICAILFFIRKKNRRSRRAVADEKFGRPGSLYTGYGAAMENEGGIGSAGGMVERKESYNSGRSREMGGPRPPTMIESGRAGMGSGRSVSPVAPMPNIGSYYTSPTGSAHIPLPPPSSSAYSTGPAQVFAVGSVMPPPQISQPPMARGQPEFYPSAYPTQGGIDRVMSPPLAPGGGAWGYGQQQQQQQQQRQLPPQQFGYPVDQKQYPQQQQFDYGGPPPLDPYSQYPQQQSPGAHPMSSPIDRMPPPQAYLPQQHHQQQLQQQQQTRKAPPPADDLDDAYGGM